MEKSNKIIQYLVNTGKIEPKGLPHFGGNQYVYKSGNSDKWEGNVNILKVGQIIFNMSDEDIELLLKSIN